MKKIAILYSEYSATVDAIEYGIRNIAQVDKFSDSKNVNPDDYDFVVLTNYNENYPRESNVINVHHSLLPSFKSNTPVEDAVLSGVKVTGLTFYYTNSFEIIAQYPIFIGNETHYDEIKQKLNYLEQTLYPLIIEKLLLNENIDIQELLKNQNSCSGNCKGCGECKS